MREQSAGASAGGRFSAMMRPVDARTGVALAWTLAPLSVVSAGAPDLAGAAYVVWFAVFLGLAVAGALHRREAPQRARLGPALIVAPPVVLGYVLATVSHGIVPAVVGAMLSTALAIGFAARMPRVGRL